MRQVYSQTHHIHRVALCAQDKTPCNSLFVHTNKQTTNTIRSYCCCWAVYGRVVCRIADRHIGFRLVNAAVLQLTVHSEAEQDKQTKTLHARIAAAGWFTGACIVCRVTDRRLVHGCLVARCVPAGCHSGAHRHAKLDKHSTTCRVLCTRLGVTFASTL